VIDGLSRNPRKGTFYLKADDEREMNEWKASIQWCIDNVKRLATAERESRATRAASAMPPRPPDAVAAARDFFRAARRSGASRPSTRATDPLGGQRATGAAPELLPAPPCGAGGGGVARPRAPRAVLYGGGRPAAGARGRPGATTGRVRLVGGEDRAAARACLRAGGGARACFHIAAASRL